MAQIRVEAQPVPLLCLRAAVRVDLRQRDGSRATPSTPPDVIDTPPTGAAPEGRAAPRVAVIQIGPRRHGLVAPDPPLAGRRTVPVQLDVVGGQDGDPAGPVAPSQRLV